MLLVVSCTSEDITINTDMGYLRLDVNTVTNTNTKGVVPENYNPKQLYVAIVDAEGKIVASTENFTSEWGNGKEFALKAGVYTIKANSNGFDGLASRYGETPYYAGETPVTVKAGNSVSANLVCTLADVKVTVRFESSFTKAFRAAEVTLSTPNVTSLRFAMGSVNSIGYLPVGDLSSSITVQTQAGEFKTQDNQVITDVKPRDHYIFVYKVDLEGDGKIEVEADDSQRTYTYTFPVTTTPSTSVKVDAANAWSNFAYLSGSVAPKDPTTVIPVDKVKFEYQLASAEEESDSWTSISVEANGTNAYKATLKGLTPGTSYRYRLNYTGDSESSLSSAKSFITETQTKGGVNFNWGFEDWYKNGRHYYPASSGNTKVWDSGNEGANTLKEVNPTCPETSDVIKGKAVKLWSTTVAGQIAAGSLFTGDFGSATVTPLGAKLSFGTAWDCKERPTQLTGYFKYNPGLIDKIKEDKVPVSKGSRDICSIYIALLDWTAPFAVSTSDDIFFKPDNSGVIAYGELSSDKTSPESMNNYEKFTIDLKYRDLTKKPTYILVVCTSSKYGDYFTGSTSSVLYLDEFDLIYGEPVIDTNYIK